ncbi:MAG: hypothetical protein DCC49_01535 [Acidobacteria bacterium]|nr:MAG: hypothetical protein DCC49_01535 [Acidobacteriota bacterium]
MAEVECESCGAPTLANDLFAVRRALYSDREDLNPEVQDVREMWCYGCCETYPNVSGDAEPDSASVPDSSQAG